MLRWQRLPLIVALPFVFASCTLASNRDADGHIVSPMLITAPALAPTVPSAAPLAAIPPASCPITQPSNSPFVPPSPYPATPPPLYAGEFWYGAASLWTMLRADGTWGKLPYTNGSYTQKVFWWRQGYGYRLDPMPI